MDQLRDRVQVAVARAGDRYDGLTVAVTHAGTTVHVHHGSADAGRPVCERTVFEIGSVTKVFTCLLLATLVVAGEVALDEPLAPIFPEIAVPVRGRPIRLVDLATHTAGLPRLPGALLWAGLRHRDNPYAAMTERDVVSALARVRLSSEPGRRVHYSNFGMGVLGLALARRMWTSYGDLLARHVTEPLSMTDTRVDRTDDQMTRRALGHDRRGRPVPDWDIPWLPGMGGLHSTPEDLARFTTAQLDPGSTPLAEALRLTHEVHVRSGRRLSLGLGWMETPLTRDGAPLRWHNGGTGGSCSFTGYVVGAGTAVTVLANRARPVDPIARRLLADLVG